MATGGAIRRIGQGSAALLAVAVAAAGCASESGGPDTVTGPEVGEFAASREYLADVADATDGLSYRMSMDLTMRFSMGDEDMEVGGEFATGEVDGRVSATTIDLGEMFGDIADQVPDPATPESWDGDMTMEMVTDGTTAYIRAPLFAAAADEMLDAGASRSEIGPLADLAELGDQWGSIDLTELSLGEIASTTGAQSADPSGYLDVIAAGGDVRELGAESIDGVEVRGLGATIAYGELITAQGGDVDQVREQMAAGFGMAQPAGAEEVEELFSELTEGILDTEVPIEAWVDGDDRVRRITVDLDMTEIMSGVAADMGDDLGEDMGDIGMSTTMTMDFTDYGDESIEIAIPSDAVDVTDAFRELYQVGGLGAAQGGGS